METLISLLNEEFLYKFLLLFARIVSFIAFMPIFGHKSVPVKVKIVFALFFTIFVFPFISFENIYVKEDLLIPAESHML